MVEVADRKHGFVAPGEGGRELRRRRKKSSGGGGSSSGSVRVTPAEADRKGKDVEVNGDEALPNISSELRTLLNREIIRAK